VSEMTQTTYDPPRPMRGWTVEATCPVCGGCVHHIADGRPDGLTARAVAGCGTCERTFAVEIRMRDITSHVGRHRRAIGRQVL